jgi:hypothetical protein
MNVFTYFQPLGLNDAKELIPLWTEAWRNIGYKPTILLAEDLDDVPDYRSFVDTVSKFPSVNPPGYDLACYVRWLAFREALAWTDTGVGLMVDLDVFPRRGLPPGPVEHDVAFLDPGKVPCAVEATFKGSMQIVKWLVSQKPPVEKINGKPHTSDMLCLQRAPWPTTDQCREYGVDAWGDCEFVHFASSRMGGRRKIDVVKEFLSSQ